MNISIRRSHSNQMNFPHHLCTFTDTSPAILCHYQHKYMFSFAIKWIDDNELLNLSMKIMR